MALYLPLNIEAALPAMQYQLQKIGELEAFLRSEIEKHGHLQKKYHRAVNAIDDPSAALATSCPVTGAVALAHC